MMYSFETIASLRTQVSAWRRAGERIALVPTMGNLHAGHIALVNRARELADRVVTSIYVNPLQFNDPADLERYPVTLEQDRAQLQAAACDAVYLPDANQLYPFGIDSSVRVSVPGLSEVLDGIFRPGHFTGVATIVAKLFNIVQPDFALFGEKDLQQLVVIRRLVDDLHIPVRIVGVETVREADGLAMSSRNSYLHPDERRLAGTLYRVLTSVRERWRQQTDSGSVDGRALEQAAMAELGELGLRPEYVSIRCGDDLSELPPHGKCEERSWYVLAAAWLGPARLIDNLRL